MEVYLLSLPLSRHRLVVPQPHNTVPQPNVLGAQEHSCDVPTVGSVRLDDQSIGGSLQRPPR